MKEVFFFLFFFEVGWAVLSVLINVAKKPFSDRTRGFRRGGVESGFPKNGDRRGGFFITTFSLQYCEVSHFGG